MSCTLGGFSLNAALSQISAVFGPMTGNNLDVTTIEKLGQEYQSEAQVWSDAWKYWGGYARAFQKWFWSSVTKQNDRIVKLFRTLDRSTVENDPQRRFQVQGDMVSWFYDKMEALVVPVNAFRSPGPVIENTRFWDMSKAVNHTIGISVPIDFVKSEEQIMVFSDKLKVMGASINLTFTYVCIKALVDAAYYSEFVNLCGSANNTRTLVSEEFEHAYKQMFEFYGCMYKNGAGVAGFKALELYIGNKLAQNQDMEPMVFIQGPTSQGQAWYSGNNFHHSSGKSSDQQIFEIGKYNAESVTENYKAPLLYTGTYALNNKTRNPLKRQHYHLRRMTNYGNARPGSAYTTASRTSRFTNIRTGNYSEWHLQEWFWGSNIFSTLRPEEPLPTPNGMQILQSIIDWTPARKHRVELTQQSIQAAGIGRDQARYIGKDGIGRYNLRDKMSMFEEDEFITSRRNPLMTDLTAARLFASAGPGFLERACRIIQDRGETCWKQLVELWNDNSSMRSNKLVSDATLTDLIAGQQKIVPAIEFSTLPQTELLDWKLKTSQSGDYKDVSIPMPFHLNELVTTNDLKIREYFQNNQTRGSTNNIKNKWETGNYGNFIRAISYVADTQNEFDVVKDAAKMNEIATNYMVGWADDVLADIKNDAVATKNLFDPVLLFMVDETNAVPVVTRQKLRSFKDSITQFTAVAKVVPADHLTKVVAAENKIGLSATLRPDQIQKMLSSVPLVRGFFEFLFEHDIPLPVNFFATGLLRLESEMVLGLNPRVGGEDVAIHYNAGSTFTKKQNTDDKSLHLEANFKIQTMVLRREYVQCALDVWPVGCNAGGGDGIFDAEVNRIKFQRKEYLQNDVDWHIFAMNYQERFKKSYTAITGRMDLGLSTEANNQGEYDEWSTAEIYNKIWGFSEHHSKDRHMFSLSHLKDAKPWDEIVAFQTTHYQAIEGKDKEFDKIIGYDLLGPDFIPEMSDWVKGDPRLLAGNGFVASGNPLNGNHL